MTWEESSILSFDSKRRCVYESLFHWSNDVHISSNFFLLLQIHVHNLHMDGHIQPGTLNMFKPRIWMKIAMLLSNKRIYYVESFYLCLPTQLQWRRTDTAFPSCQFSAVTRLVKMVARTETRGAKLWVSIKRHKFENIV